MKKAFPIALALFLTVSSPLTVYASADPGDDDSGLMSGLLDGLKDLFIPDEDFFGDFNSDIRDAIDAKTGGLASSFGSIMDEFSRLSSSGSMNSVLKLTLPANLLYDGYGGTSVNLLSGIDIFATWFRGLFSAFLVVVTIIQCYRKTTALFKG